MSKTKAIVMFSGGLDSLLAVKILQAQDIEVEGFTMETLYHSCTEASKVAAEKLGIPLTVAMAGDEYLELIRNPKWGFGKAMNPCMECRAFMCKMAIPRMEEIGAAFIATGEVSGQRPNSQKEHQLRLVAREAGLEGKLLRPLSAKVLAKTQAEREGLVDRNKLYGFTGRGRSRLIALAQEFGIEDSPQPSTGCLLTEQLFVSRIRDLLRHKPDATDWDFRTLKPGRHLRIDENTKVVVGRREQENRELEELAAEDAASESVFLYPVNFNGPGVLWIGKFDERTVSLGGAILLRYSKVYDPENAEIQVFRNGNRELVIAHESEEAETFKPL
jgi:tRNA-uridine 2-sulfurtransferase